MNDNKALFADLATNTITDKTGAIVPLKHAKQLWTANLAISGNAAFKILATQADWDFGMLAALMGR